MINWNSTHTALICATAITITAIQTHLVLTDVVLIVAPILAYAGIREAKRIKG